MYLRVLQLRDNSRLSGGLHNFPYEIKAEGDLRQKGKINTQKRKYYKDGGRDWSDVATSQGNHQPPQTIESQETDSPLSLQRECGLRLPASRTLRG